MFARPPPRYEVLDLKSVRRLSDDEVLERTPEITAQLPEFVRRCLGFRWDQSPQTPLLPGLYPFQLAGVRKANVFGGSILFADEMGVGKTFQALATVAYQQGRVLVVCPSYLKSNWRHEAEQRAQLPFIVMRTTKALEKQPAAEGHWVVSYEVAARNVAKLATAGFSSVIFDECHMLKNPRSKRWKSLRRLAAAIPRRVLCSGTPAPNGFHWELYCQMKMVRPELLSTWTDFVWRYTRPRKNPFGGLDYNRNQLAAELSFILARCFQVRRLKRDVLSDLPSKSRQRIWLDGSVPSRLSGTYKRWETLADDDFEKKTLLSQLYLMTCEAKLSPVVQYFRESELPRRFLVFAHHRVMMEAIFQTLRESSAEIPVAMISGATAMEERQSIVERFQKDMSLDRLVLSLGACGTGLTLTRACTHVFFSELHWSPADLLQAEDRTHRIGVEGNVHVSYLVVKGTLDDLMWRILEKKVRNINGLDQRSDGAW